MYGIVIDIVMCLIILLSTIEGYKKGLIKLGAKLFAGILAIIITLILFNPVSALVINNTSLDERIENAISENANKVINEQRPNSNTEFIQNATDGIVDNLQNNFVPEQSQNTAIGIVKIITIIVLFIFVNIILSIVFALADGISKLPILNQFNKAGGIIFGALRGALIVCIIILIIGVVARINPQSNITEKVNETYLTKQIYGKIVKF